MRWFGAAPVGAAAGTRPSRACAAAGDAERGLAASWAALEVLLQPLRERTARPEDQRLHRRLGEAELLGDLPVGESLPFAQQDRPTLALGHLLEHVLEPHELVGDARRRG